MEKMLSSPSLTPHLLLLLALVVFNASQTEAVFYPGRIRHSENEYPELSGWMSIRQAIHTCEVDLECAGFTFQGTLDDYQSKTHVGFFRFAANIINNGFEDIDWNSYLVDRPMATYAHQVSFSSLYHEHPDAQWMPGSELFRHCLEMNVTAVALHDDGTARFYTGPFDMSSFKRNSKWNTFVNLYADPNLIMGLNQKEKVNFCCPNYKVQRLEPWSFPKRGDIERISCNITTDRFQEEYVRLGKPVILTGCDFANFTNRIDLSLERVMRYFHDNNTSPELEYHLQPRPGFTHVRTPNSQFDCDQHVINSYEFGHLRSFNRIRFNPQCEQRSDQTCRLFQEFGRPPPIPEDLYVKTGFENDLDWIIVSQENTGSHPHNDPDLTGAWNYLFNGMKQWVVFPKGLEAKYINCNSQCTGEPNHPHETYRWFLHVLPQLRDLTVYGQKPLEFVQHPGEALYLPHGLTHAILNLRDNVAITENYLFVDALPELMSKIALNQISKFRPNWDYKGFTQLYFNLTSSKDRQLLRSGYLQALERIQRFPGLCDEAEASSEDRFQSLLRESNKGIFEYVSI